MPWIWEWRWEVSGLACNSLNKGSRSMRNVMLSLRTFLFVLGVLFCGNALAESTLTNDAVEEFLESVRQAANNRDVAEILSHFSSRAEVEINMPPAMGGHLRLGLSDYKKMLAESWAATTNYEIRSGEVTVDIAPDGKSATARAMSYEKAEILGQVVITTAIETVQVQLESGMPKITHVFADVKSIDGL